MNFSAVLYPVRADFEAWAELGNNDWTPDKMAPYLRKFHKYTDASATTKELLSLDKYMDGTKQGDSGPVPVTMPDIYGEFNKAWDATFEQLGWQSGEDPISGMRQGAFTCPLTVDAKTGKRGYAAAYYSPEVAKRPNLQLLPETRVEKVLFSDEKAVDGNAIARGIQIRTKDGLVQQVTARREVILSAGALQTPQLLELSGVGSKGVLKRYEIPVVIDSPGVGENLQDHSLSHISYEVADGQVSGDVLRDPNVLQALIKLYQETHGGPLSGMPISIAFLPLVDGAGRVEESELRQLVEECLDINDKSLSPAQAKQYDIIKNMLFDPHVSSAEYLFLPLQMHTNPGKTSFAEILSKDTPGNFISILALNNHPFSRGSVHIQSANIDEKPHYDPNFLSHPLDIEILARHTQYMDKIVKTEPLASLLKPGSCIPANADASSIESAKEVVKGRLLSCFHPSGTCAMMPRDIGGVVDSNLVVHGSKNLRVVDASVFPMIPTGNIQATVYAVAEKAADIIKEQS